jgi:hypothetical protein
MGIPGYRARESGTGDFTRASPRRIKDERPSVEKGPERGADE